MNTAVKTSPRVMPNPLRGSAAYAPKTARVLDDAYLTMLIYSDNIEFEEKLDRLRQHTGGRIPENMRALCDADFLSLIEDIHNGKTPGATRKEVLMAIACGNVSDDIVEDLEDAVLLKMMSETAEDGDDESVSEEEVLGFLRQR